MARPLTLVLAPLLTGCALLGHEVAAQQPLDNEGEIYLELRPFAPAAAGLVIELESVSAVRDDGLQVPLALLVPDLSAAITQQRLLAQGRLAPGSYTGFALRVRRATLRTQEGRADLLLPEEPPRIEAPFQIARRRATVLEVELQPAGAVRKGFAFAPAFTVSAPPRTMVQLTGWCSASGAHSLVVFDKHTREVTAVVPTGRAPWGLALDGVLNRAYVALTDDDQIAVIDIASGEELSRIRLSSGDSPRELLLSADRKLLLAANAGSNTVSFIDPASGIETGRAQVGEQPASLLADRRGSRVYVFNLRGNSISVVDTASRSVVATAPTDNSPLRGQIDRAGTRLFVASPRSAYLTAFSLPGLSVLSRVYVGLGTTALKLDADTDLLYVANADRRLSIYDPFSLIPIDTLELPDAPAFLAIDGAENVLFALMPESRALTAINLTTKKTVATLDCGAQPRVVAMFGERN